jgi:hypothetical protein
MTAQLAMEFEIVPTIAMRAGEQYVVQCSWCGTLVCVPSTSEGNIVPPESLRDCPACDSPTGSWWRQSLPVGPFRHVRKATA